MIHSMTGYASASREFSYGVLNLELRSVNHRYLDIQFRLPDELRSVESQLREVLAARFARGKVDCRAGFATGAGAGKALHLNEDLMREVAALAARVRRVLPDAADLRTADILRWPGMLGSDALPGEELQQACRELLGRAIEDLAATRRREGERLKSLLLGIMAKHTGQPLEVIERDSDRDYYLEAKGAVEYGLVDQVLEAPEKVN